jgi:hypothetical protein
MKKLLVLMLVLGMTSIASAGLTLVTPAEIDEATTGVIGINNPDGLDYGCYLDIGLVSEGGFSLVSVDLTTLAGDLSSVSVYDYGDFKEAEIFLANSTGTTTPGIQAQATIECLMDKIDVIVELYDAGTFQLIDSAIIKQVPEPMTVALLGLGGLFLLRRRK